MNCSWPMKPFSGTLPYATPQPSNHQESAAMQASSKFFSSTDDTNPSRQHPASSIAKPACMYTTSAAQMIIHICVMADSTPANCPAMEVKLYVISSNTGAFTSCQ